MFPKAIRNIQLKKKSYTRIKMKIQLFYLKINISHKENYRTHEGSMQKL